MADLEDERPGRALLNAGLAMVGVALVVGLVVGAVAMVALRDVVGDTEANADARDEQSLFIPKYKPTKGADDDPKVPGIQEPDESDEAKPSPKPKKPQVTLFVAPQQVAPGGRINFNGVYRQGREGATLDIQRKQGGSWTDFPVDATVRGGTFETWIQTSVTGEQVFRVYDAANDRPSNTVTVTVG